MPEPIIKFAADYEKLPLQWEGTRAILRRVEVVLLERQTLAFLDYDVTMRNGKKYHLPLTGEFLLLFFKHDSGAVFTTLSRSTFEKRKFYLAALHQSFKLVRENAEEPTP